MSKIVEQMEAVRRLKAAAVVSTWEEEVANTAFVNDILHKAFEVGYLAGLKRGFEGAREETKTHVSDGFAAGYNIKRKYETLEDLLKALEGEK